MWEKYLNIPNWISVSRGDVNKTILSLRLPRGSSALDIGCGFGRISLFLNKQGFDVTAIDNYMRMVRLMKAKGIKAMLMDADNLKFKDKKFDLVFSDGLLEHFEREENIIKIIKEQTRVSKKYVLNFIPQDSFLNIIMERIQRVPKEYRNRDWVKLHESAIPEKLRNKCKIQVKKLFRLNAYVIKKS